MTHTVHALPIDPISSKSWDAVLAYCRTLDVEEGEGPEYQYAVRGLTRTLTIWTAEGWQAGWYQARVRTQKRGKKVELLIETGTAPKEKALSLDAVKTQVLRLVSQCAPEEGI